MPPTRQRCRDPNSARPVQGQLIAHLGADRHELRGAFHQSQEVPVARITRIGQQPVLARIHQQAGGQQQRTGAAGSNQDPFGVNA